MGSREEREQAEIDFKFLTEDSHYVSTEQMFISDEHFFDYKVKNGDIKQSGSIHIPYGVNYEVNWYYREECRNYEKKIRRIEATPIWFQELFEKAKERREIRDRLSRIFGNL
jgi:hypothetical protein